MNILLSSDINEILELIEETMSSIENIFASTDGILAAVLSIIGILVAAFSSVIGIVSAVGTVAISLIVAIGSAVILFIEYLIPAICLFRMGRKEGYKYAWLAFIPILQTYVEFTIPRQRFKVFFIDTKKRDIVAIIFILAGYLGGTLLQFVGILIDVFVPVGGVAVMTLIELCYLVFFIAIKWRKKYDLLMSFMDKEGSMILSIISFFVPFLYTIGLIICSFKEPKIGRNNYYNVNMEKAEKPVQQ